MPRLAKPDVSAEPAAGKLYAGTSGWAYPTWKPGFYPVGVSSRRFLEYYAQRLSSVEVNYTFRKLPTARQVAEWLAATPAGFRFSFKVPQRITHFNRLRDCAAPLAEFLASIEPFRKAGKLGLLLFQLPPNFKATNENQQRLADLLKLPQLRRRAIAFEFRHESWFVEPVYTLLKKRSAVLCIAANDDLATPEIHTSATRTCFRLRHTGCYTPRQLAALATRMAALAETREVYVYFKHEDEPTGALNALDFLGRVRKLAAKKGTA